MILISLVAEYFGDLIQQIRLLKKNLKQYRFLFKFHSTRFLMRGECYSHEGLKGAQDVLAQNSKNGGVMTIVSLFVQTLYEPCVHRCNLLQLMCLQRGDTGEDE